MAHRHEPTDPSALLDVIAHTVPVVGFDWDLLDNTIGWSATTSTLEAWKLGPQDTGHTLLEHVHPDDLLRVRRSLREHLRGETESCDLSHRRRHPTLGWRRVRASGRAERDRDGKPVHLVGALFDIHDEQAHAEQMAVHARSDALTGLHNRVALIETLERSFARRTLGSSAGLLMADLDRFRSINRSLGPQAGDRLLCHAAETLRRLAPASAFIARLGADQFAVLLPADCQREPEQLAEEIVRALAQPIDIDEHEIVVGASVGVLKLDHRFSDVATAMRDAENALGRAKDAGGGRWSPFVADAISHTDRLSLEARLRHALDDQSLELWYQPIVQLPMREIVAFEALIRWNDPTLGWVSPGRFIPVAEETGLIVPIGDWVLEEACKTLHTWRGTPSGAHLRLNVNLSAVQFRQSDLVERLDSLLDRYPRARGFLNLELTETALLERPNDQVEVLERLRALGCQLHVDDFGTGYSSLSNLVKLPVDALKVDREFVMRAEDDRKSLAVVRMVARMAQEMGLSLTAEGIETEGQVHLLNALGRCRGQGYLFSKPLPEEKAFSFLVEPMTLVLQETLLREAG